MPTGTLLLSGTMASCKNTDVNIHAFAFTWILDSLQSILHRYDQKRVINPGASTKIHLFYLALKAKNKDQKKLFYNMLGYTKLKLQHL